VLFIERKSLREGGKEGGIKAGGVGLRSSSAVISATIILHAASRICCQRARFGHGSNARLLWFALVRLGAAVHAKGGKFEQRCTAKDQTRFDAKEWTEYK
jgi:hypothetical protein